MYSNDIVKTEQEIQKYWQDNNIFQKALDLTKNFPLFNFYEGPPFASGSPHLGHLITKSIKDTVIRYKSQTGYYVPRVAGWDTHGLPLETKGQQILNVNTRQEILDLGIDKFNNTCRQIVMTARDEWEKTTKRFGQWIDFENEYKTMDFSYMNNIWYVFKQLFDKNLVYRGIKVMPYSTGCSTVWSNFEANQNMKEVSDPALTVKLKLLNPENLNLSPSLNRSKLFGDVYFLVFTTTPWTLPINLAIAINENLEYVYLEHHNEIYICEKSSVLKYFNDINSKVLKIVSGSTLIGMKYQPLYPYYNHLDAFKVIHGSFVTSDTGTGIVHLSPGFGADDYKACLDANIIKPDNVPCPIDDLGKYTQEIKQYEGLYVKQADKKIISELKSQNLVFKLDYEKHNYPYCWRTDTPLLYRAYPCWFIKVTDLKDKLIENNKKINWVPKFVGENRFGNWLESVIDWCVSRNRFWGTPIPIWVNNDFSEIVCIGSVEELETLGYRLDELKEPIKLKSNEIKDLHRDSIDKILIPSNKNSGTWLHRIDEIFDCWFESGAMPYASHNMSLRDGNNPDFKRYFPADFISESIDQVRGWFYTLNVLSTALYDEPAFKNCVVSGLVLAEDGHKMSKSKGNYSPPEEIMDKYGADALRLYLLSSPVVAGETLLFKNEDMKKIVNNVHVYLLNILKFLDQMIHYYEQSNNKEFKVQTIQTDNIVDSWLYERTIKYNEEIHRLMKNYDLQMVYVKIYDYIQDLSNVYLKLNRSYMKTPDAYLSLNTLYWSLYYFSVTTAPFAPMLMEHIFLSLKKYNKEQMESVHLVQIPSLEKIGDNTLLKPFEDLMKVIMMTRNLRGLNKIPARRPLKELVIISEEGLVLEGLKELEHLLVEELNVLDVKFTKEESSYVKYKIDLNYKTAGKKYKNKIKDLSKVVNELSQDKIITLMTNKEIQLDQYVLTFNDVTISREPLQKDFLFGSEDNISLLIDKEMTDEVEKLYIAKQLNRSIQDLRKTLGLVITDQIDMYYETKSKLLLEIVKDTNLLKFMKLQPYNNEQYFGKTEFIYGEKEDMTIYFSK